ncbi:hypothetical protein ACWHAN_24335 [Streptomyces albidoflavus]|uniref:hypothetical protein n=1 Tax=Streptomyces TaxID=1883 RepID=UPI002F912266|nr:hypothetical protein OHA76_00095 [Streptomyces albidoflavus]WSD57110.1 hypothetical protein OHA76_32105 [Streptomyces albidoflavus]WTC39874.1 hypothetical protein OH723_31365 [Streptomyces albidoflavus]WTC46069.1 hypothetical protein OH810_31340 [Streptomyces albidoflavus]WTD45893.1 hypothetical protein OH730_30675 [Streptomyces albidoflavus]
MNLYISAVNALIFAAACAVGVIVYRSTKNQQTTAGTTAPRGDLAVALAAAAAAVLMLAFLFGVGDGSSTGAELPSSTEPAASFAPPPRR